MEGSCDNDKKTTKSGNLVTIKNIKKTFLEINYETTKEQNHLSLKNKI